MTDQQRDMVGIVALIVGLDSDDIHSVELPSHAPGGGLAMTFYQDDQQSPTAIGLDFGAIDNFFDFNQLELSTMVLLLALLEHESIHWNSPANYQPGSCEWWCAEFDAGWEGMEAWCGWLSEPGVQILNHYFPLDVATACAILHTMHAAWFQAAAGAGLDCFNSNEPPCPSAHWPTTDNPPCFDIPPFACP